MNDKQLENYLKIENEIESLNARKYKFSTRKVYKRFALKFIKSLLENNIEISAFRNITTENLKQYAKIEIGKGRKIDMIINELRGVTYYCNLLNRNKAQHRRQTLIDLRILQKWLENMEESGA